MNQAEEDAPGAIAEVHSDNLRWLISDDDPRRPIGYALLYTDEAIRAAVAQERERAAKYHDKRASSLRDSRIGFLSNKQYAAAERLFLLLCEHEESAAAIRRGE